MVNEAVFCACTHSSRDLGLTIKFWRGIPTGPETTRRSAQRLLGCNSVWSCSVSTGDHATKLAYLRQHLHPPPPPPPPPVFSYPLPLNNFRAVLSTTLDTHTHTQRWQSVDAVGWGRGFGEGEGGGGGRATKLWFPFKY